nr:hemolysin III family protein [Mobiluncus mulieris]
MGVNCGIGGGLMVPAPENPGNTGNSAGSPVSPAVCGVPADAGVLAAAPVAPVHEVPPAASAASPTSAAPIHEVPSATPAFPPEAAAPIPIYGPDVHAAHPDATTAHLERRNRLSQRIPKGFPHPINPKTGRPYRFPRWDWKTMRRKPALRGWIHTVATPLSLAASIVLLVLAPWGLKAACAIYLAASLVLFAMSAVYHQGSWSRRVDGVLRRFDHANIFLLIAGTYTPVSVGLLTPAQATVLLSVVWVGAVLGIAVSLIWPGSPRWFSTLLYVILGWAAVMYLPQIFAASLPAFWLLVAGGLAYTVGAVVYALKWPNPSQKYFGFHEIFHSWTVAAWACHCVAAYFSILG